MDHTGNPAFKIPILLSDLLNGLLPSDGPGIIDLAACFGFRGNVFIGRCLVMDDFLGPYIPAFSCDVTLLPP